MMYTSRVYVKIDDSSPNSTWYQNLSLRWWLIWSKDDWRLATSTDLIPGFWLNKQSTAKNIYNSFLIIILPWKQLGRFYQNHSLLTEFLQKYKYYKDRNTDTCIKYFTINGNWNQVWNNYHGSFKYVCTQMRWVLVLAFKVMGQNSSVTKKIGYFSPTVIPSLRYRNRKLFSHWPPHAGPLNRTICQFSW